MRHALRFLAIGLASLLGTVALLLAVVVAGTATAPGRTAIERLVPKLSAGEVQVSGLSGWIFGSSRIARLELRDPNGTWLTIEGLTIDWAPLRLLAGEALVRRVAADRIDVARRPVASGETSGGGTPELPVRVVVDALAIGRIDLAAPVAGRAASLAVDGALRLDAMDRGTAGLDVRRLDGPGTYAVQATLNAAGLHATVHLTEPEGGLIGSLANLPAIGAIAVNATLAGPLDAVTTHVAVTAGKLNASASGQIDLTHQSADLTVSASAPAMAPRPDLSWRGVTLRGQVQGTMVRPRASASLTIDGLVAGAAGIRQVTADVKGDAGTLTLQGALAGVRLPGAQPDLLASAPVTVTAALRLDAPDRPATFTVSHPLFTVTGTASLAGARHAEARIDVPEIAPLAAAGGVAGVAGKVALTLRAALQGDDTQIEANGSIRLTTAPGPTTALLGSETHLDAQAMLRGQAVTLSRFDINSGTLIVGMQGALAPGMMDLHWTVALSDLSKLQPTLSGPLRMTGTAHGSPDDLAVDTAVIGDVGAPGLAPGPITAQIALTGLPTAPRGTVQATGTLLGSPLALKLAAQRDGQTTNVSIEQATWKSAHAEGQLQVTPSSLVPMGRVTFAMTRLDDLQPLLGRALRGSVSGALDGTAEGTHLIVTAAGAGLPGTASVAKGTLDATVNNPTSQPTVNARLALDGVAAGGVGGTVQLTAQGKLDALAVRLSAALPNLSGAPAKLDAAGTVDATGRVVTLSSAQVSWRQQTLRLLAPTRIALADGVSVERLRLGMRQAVLEANGRVSPTLDLTARLQGLPASLAGQVNPAFAADGTLDAEAKLTGAPDHPSGTIRVTARGLRAATGPGRALPALNLTANATLQGTSAQIDTRATAGASHVAVTGTVGLAGDRTLNLRATGAMDLAMTDPLLTPNGRRARGKLTMDATINGTAQAPRISGNAQLADGSFRDFVQGVDLSDMAARVQADGGTIRLTQFTAKAGPGTLGATGTIDLTAPGAPLDLSLTARNARPLANDLLTASLDADLTLRGNLAGPLAARGHVLVRRVDIRIPERLPAGIAVLDVRTPGAPPPPPPVPGPQVTLALTIDAPQQIFVRGRGVDAELGGKVELAGSAAQPVPSGGFTLRQGQFSLAGQTLTFTSGQVSFSNGSLTDPSLNFVASTTAGSVTANLTITGTASNPKITLSSTPSLPQDEVLSYLLYGTRTASLGPLEIAQIAATLASLSGAAPSLSNPLDNVRQALGLDRLSMGAGSQLEAGRYVARNVYAGVRQSVTGTGTQAVVQVDLAKGLKLEATAGTSSTQSATGAGGSADAASVGITYQFNY